MATRVAIHLVYAGGVTSPGPGTYIRYGPYIFYCNLDYESYLNHGHELYLTDNGVVLTYESIGWMSHPLSGYSLHFFLKAFELGKLQGNCLSWSISRGCTREAISRPISTPTSILVAFPE